MKEDIEVGVKHIENLDREKVIERNKACFKNDKYKRSEGDRYLGCIKCLEFGWHKDITDPESVICPFCKEK